MINATRNTMDAWATPVDPPVLDKIADHTFVVCEQERFRCWGGSDTGHREACKVTSGSGKKALCKSTKYRGPMDSACLGIYAVNGVCHQSTNLFLYAVDGTVLPLNKARPRGVLASHALYTVYGTAGPGQIGTAPGFLAAWLSAVYAQAYIRCGGPFGDNSDELPEEVIFEGLDENSLVYKIVRNNYDHENGSAGGNHLVTSDMRILLDHHLGMADHPILSVHQDILRKKDGVLSGYGLTEPEIGVDTTALTDADAKTLSASLNELAIAFQDDLKSKIGGEAYTALNGDDGFYAPVNPVIAAEALADLTKYRK